MEQQQRISLATKYFLGTLSEEEEAIVQKYLDGCSDSERQAFLSLADEERTLADLKDYYDVKPDVAVGDSHSTRSGGLLRKASPWRWVISTAAVVLLFLGGLVIWKVFFVPPKHTGRNEGSLAAIPKILPGGNRATLTLASGQVVTLDSMAGGTVTRQGAVSVVKLGSGQIAYQFENNNTNPYTHNGYNMLETPVGGQYQVVLPDQTKVWLNSSSSIRFPVSFAGFAERRVEIRGEAYLEVAKDARHPFVALVGSSEVRVLGTHFNIMAYPDEGAMRTTLLEGSVAVTSGGRHVVITPKEQAVVKAGELRVEKDVNTATVTAWKEGNFAFAGADIETVMRQLSRWYGVKVEVRPSVSKNTIDADISRANDIGEVFKMLAYAGYHFEIKEGKTVVVY